MKRLQAALTTPSDLLSWRVRVPILLFLALSTVSDLTAAGDIRQVVVIVAVTGALAIAINRSGLGAVLFVSLMIASVVMGVAAELGIATLLMIGLVAATNTVARTIAFVMCCIAWTWWAVAAGLFQSGGVLWVVMPLYVLATGSGILIRQLVHQRQRDRLEIDSLTDQVARARASERRQLAGELHDIVAHDLTLLVMLSSLGASLDDDDRKRQTFERMERSARSALADLRRLFGVLERSGSADSAGQGQVTTTEDVHTDLHEATKTLTDLGFRIRLLEQGDLERIPSSLQHALRRSLREILSNVAKYARPGSEVAISYVVSDNEAALRVCNTLPIVNQEQIVPKGGTGLVHLQEQADAFGGRFSVTVEEDLWCVDLSLPWTE